jgi:hypothetical protein
MSKREKEIIQSGTRAIALFPPIDVKMLIRTWDRDITLSDYLCWRCRIINIEPRRERERNMYKTGACKLRKKRRTHTPCVNDDENREN